MRGKDTEEILYEKLFIEQAVKSKVLLLTLFFKSDTIKLSIKFFHTLCIVSQRFYGYFFSHLDISDCISQLQKHNSNLKKVKTGQFAMTVT